MLLCPVLNAKLKHMDPSVHCSDTAMSVQVKGFRAPRFLVNSGRFHKESFNLLQIYKSMIKIVSIIKQVRDL